MTKECKHIWHTTFSERSLHSEHNDLVTVGLYCPKCLTTKTLEYIIPLSREGKTDQQVVEALRRMAKESQYIKVNLDLIWKNLTRLGYKTEEVENLFQASAFGDSLNTAVFKGLLKPDHQIQVDAIIRQELVG